MITKRHKSLALALMLASACGRPEPGTDATAPSPDIGAPEDTLAALEVNALTSESPDASDASLDAASDALADDAVAAPVPPPRAPTLRLAPLDALEAHPALPLADRLFDLSGLPACAADGMHVAYIARGSLPKARTTRPVETRSLRIVRVLDGATVEDLPLVSAHELVPREGESERDLVERLTPRLRNRLRTAQKALEPSEDSGLIAFREMTGLSRSGAALVGRLGGHLRPPTARSTPMRVASVTPRPDGQLEVLLPGFAPTLTAPLLTLSRPDCDRPHRSREPLPDAPCLPSGCTTRAELAAVHVDEEFGVILARLEPVPGPCDPLPRHLVLTAPPPR